jgi:hypothetical protein
MGGFIKKVDCQCGCQDKKEGNPYRYLFHGYFVWLHKVPE